MRRNAFILFLSLGGILFAEGIPLSFGGNLGADMSTPMGYAFNMGFHGDYEFLPDLKVGIQQEFSFASSFFNSNTSAYAKWYTPFDFSFPGFYIIPFIKGNIGVSYLKYKEMYTTAFLIGAEAGIKLDFESVPGLYVEPFLKFGYPYFWGFGVAAGYSLDK